MDVFQCLAFVMIYIQYVCTIKYSTYTTFICICICLVHMYICTAEYVGTTYTTWYELELKWKMQAAKKHFYSEKRLRHIYTTYFLLSAFLTLFHELESWYFRWQQAFGFVKTWRFRRLSLIIWSASVRSNARPSDVDFLTFKYLLEASRASIDICLFCACLSLNIASSYNPFNQIHALCNNHEYT